MPAATVTTTVAVAYTANTTTEVVPQVESDHKDPLGYPRLPKAAGRGRCSMGPMHFTYCASFSSLGPLLRSLSPLPCYIGVVGPMHCFLWAIDGSSKF